MTTCRESPGREHDQTHDAQRAPEDSGRQARRAESTIQGEEVDGPQGKDAQVQDIFHGVRRPDLGESHDRSRRLGRRRSHEHAHNDEDGNQKDAAYDPGRATLSQDAFLLLHLLYIVYLPFLHDPCLSWTIAFIHSSNTFPPSSLPWSG